MAVVEKTMHRVDNEIKAGQVKINLQKISLTTKTVSIQNTK